MTGEFRSSQNWIGGSNLKDTEREILTLGRRAANARRLLSLLYRKSIATAADISSFLEIPTPTAIGSKEKLTLKLMRI